MNFRKNVILLVALKTNYYFDKIYRFCRTDFVINHCEKFIFEESGC